MFIRVCGGRKKSEKFVSTKGTISVTTNVSGASVKITSGGSVVYSKEMNPLENSIETASLAPGEYEIEITKDGYDPFKQTVTVNGNVKINADLKESIKTGAFVEVANAIAGYENAVLVNDNALVNIAVKDAQGNPVANKSVVLSLSNEKLYNAEAKDAGFEIKGNTVVTTNADGIASFIVGTKKQGLKADTEDYVGSVQLSASVVGSSDKKDTTSAMLRFVAIKMGTVNVATNVNNSKNLVKGENAASAGTASEINTTALSGKSSAYIATQQVSKKDSSEHEVKFSVSPKIVLPTFTQESEDVQNFIQTIDKKSEKYGTYTDKEDTITLDVDTSKLQYATLNFNKIQLSSYTRMIITCYQDKDCKNLVPDSKLVIDGEKEQSNFAYQIPLTKYKVSAIKVKLESAGQVQTDKNDGYDIKNITGVYNLTNASGGFVETDLNTASVKWDVVTPTYSNEKKLEVTDAVDVLGIIPADKKNSSTTESKFTYTVPVFQYTGNAVIKEYDKNNKVIAYYLAPTENNYKYTAKDGKTYDNTNEIAALVEKAAKTAGDANTINTGLKAYKATKEEAETVLDGKITPAGKTVTVNSEKVGSTNIKATVSIDGLGTEQLNAMNSTLFTSVHWNPLPTGKQEEITVNNSKVFAALAGQKINVYAQLTDVNGNPVSLSGQDVTFKYGKTEIKTEDKYVDGATIVSNTGKTDVNGIATLALSAGEKKSLANLSAVSGDEKYNVVLYVGEANKEKKAAVTSADLYWIEANLSFTNSVIPTIKSVTTENDSKELSVYDEKIGTPKVGTPWEFAVRTVGNTPDKGKLAGYTVSIDGLKIAMSGDVDNKGTYDFTKGNGVALATSKIAQGDKIISKIDKNSISGDITFTASGSVNGVSDTQKLPCVGVGSPNLNAKLTLGIDWQREGTKMALVTPVGTRIANDGVAEVDIRVTDRTGENVCGGETVYFRSGSETDKFFSDSEASTEITAISNANDKHKGYYELTTDSNGIATVYIKKGDKTGASSIISAEMNNVDQIISTTVNWVNDTTGDFHVVNAAMKDGSKNEVVLTFNNEVNSDSVVPGEFTVFSKQDATKNKYYDVKSVSVSGKKVTLTLGSELPAERYYVGLGDKKVNGVSYHVVDEAGKEITKNGMTAVNNTAWEISFYSTMNASFNIDVKSSNAKETITVSDVKDPSGNFSSDVASTMGFFLTVDDKVISSTSDDSSYNLTGDVYTISGSSKRQKISVYYMGNVETKIIEPNTTVKTATDAFNDAVVIVKSAGTKTDVASTAAIDFSDAKVKNKITYTDSSDKTDKDNILKWDDTNKKFTVAADGKDEHKSKTAYFAITVPTSSFTNADVADNEVLYFEVNTDATGTKYSCKEITSTVEAAQKALDSAKIGVPTIASYTSTAAIKPAAYTGYSVTNKSASNSPNTVVNSNGTELNSGSASKDDYDILSLTYTSDTYGGLVERVVKYKVAATASQNVTVDGVEFTPYTGA